MARLTITRPRERVEQVAYSRRFERRDLPGAGFAFDCDALGNISPLHPAGADSFAKCLDGTFDVIDHGIEHRSWTYMQPAEGTCTCGCTVILDGDTQGEGIDCECGRIYNSFGQELAPREQWEENQYDDY